MAMVNPPTVFSDPAFEMTYSGAWWSVHSSLRDHLTCEQVECVLWLNQGYGQTRILVMRSGTLLDRMASLEDTAELVWAGVQSAGGELIQEPAALEVGGQPAQQAVFSDGQSVTLLTITKQPDRSFIVIRADTPTDGSADALADVEAIISSIRFK